MWKEMLPVIIHIAAVVVITALFIIGYVKQRYLYQILFAIWAPTTLLRYLSSNRIYLIVLTVVQVLMFLAVIFALFRGRKDIEEEQPAGSTEPDGQEDQALAAEEPEEDSAAEDLSEEDDGDSQTPEEG